MAFNATQPHVFNIRAVRPQPAALCPAGPAPISASGGLAAAGTNWWYGEGPPGTIVGAQVGDYYMDNSSGMAYRLGD